MNCQYHIILCQQCKSSYATAPNVKRTDKQNFTMAASRHNSAGVFVFLSCCVTGGLHTGVEECMCVCVCVSHRLIGVSQRVAGVTRDKSLSVRRVSAWEAAPRVKWKRRVWERSGRRTAIITGLMGRTNGATGSNYRPFLTPTQKQRPSCWGASLARPGVTEYRAPGGNREALQGQWKRAIHFKNGSLLQVRQLGGELWGILAVYLCFFYFHLSCFHVCFFVWEVEWIISAALW